MYTNYSTNDLSNPVYSHVVSIINHFVDMLINHIFVDPIQMKKVYQRMN